MSKSFPIEHPLDEVRAQADRLTRKRYEEAQEEAEELRSQDRVQSTRDRAEVAKEAEVVEKKVEKEDPSHAIGKDKK